MQLMNIIGVVLFIIIYSILAYEYDRKFGYTYKKYGDKY